ncbi:hypothetical protein LSH36_251g05012 [Paralvinella palmiformis]|uniref:Vitellogenin domain-containing protein n=1 Tax=Paralvinella palmiformis TaxID=53620 RepID=A0AAD9JLP0_9ANNE|nr:hypothetical protein LSH36_251g05012 [Paralvinella palmiformis]
MVSSFCYNDQPHQLVLINQPPSRPAARPARVFFGFATYHKVTTASHRPVRVLSWMSSGAPGTSLDILPPACRDLEPPHNKRLYDLSVFTPDREYRYDYESQILTGIPLLNDQYSGIRIKARVIMHIAADNYVAVKLTGMEVFRVKEESGVIPTTWVMPSMLEAIPAEHAAVIIGSLDLPIKFRYDSGLVTKVYAMSSDPYWSVNIKRGVVSMMNLDLNIENPVQADSIPSKAFMNVVSPDYNIMSTKSTYRVVEPSVLGDCETVYSLVPVPAASKMIVSKVIDAKKCSPRVMGEWGLFAGVLSEEAFGDMNNIAQPIVAVDYELSGSRHEFLIESAVLTGKYVFAPIMKEMASIDGYVIQKLTYIKDEPIERPITFASTPVPLRRGLHAYIPSQDLVTMEAFGVVGPGEGVMEKAKMGMIDNLLEAIIEKTTEKVGSEIPDMISTMVTVMRKMSKSEITEIINKYFSPRMFGAGVDIDRKRSIIMDVISTLPHPETPIILVEMVKKGYITSDVYGAVLINVASLLVTPSPAVINTFVQMAKDPVIRSKPMIYRAVILGSGIFVNRLVNLHIRMGMPSAQTAAILKGAVKELKTMLEISDVNERVAIVKAIGNAGIVDFFPDIERVIKDKTYPAIVRMEAIFAMRRLAPVAPVAIQNVVLPAFLDIKEPEDIRIAAFLMIMETRPAFAMVHMIGRSIIYEPNQQIAAFVYRYMLNMARTSIPELRPLSIAAKRVLMMVRPVIVSPYFFSGAYRWEAFYAKYNVGSIFTVDKLHRVSHSFPYYMMSKLHVHLYGKTMNVAEIGLNITGLDGIARKLFGMKGMIGDIMSGRVDITRIFDDLRAPDWGQMEDEIRELMKQMTIAIDSKEMINMAAFVKLMGHELNYISLGRDEIVDVINMVKSSSIRMMDMLINGYDVDIVKAIPLMDNSIVVPTPVGLPISVNFSLMSAMAVKGRATVDGIARLSAILTDPAKVTIGAAIRPSFSIMAYQTVGIIHDIIEVGTTVKGYITADLPMSFKVIVDKTSEKISVKMAVPREVVPTVSAGVMPILFTHFVPLRPADYSASLYDIHLPKGVPVACDKVAKMVPISMESVIPIVFMKATVQGVISYPLPPVVDPVLIAISRQEISVFLKPMSSTPEAVLLEFIYGERKAVSRKAESSGAASWFGWFSNDEPVEEAVVGDEFVAVEASPLIVSPIKREFYINLMTVGGYDDAKIKTKFTVLYDPAWNICQTSIQMVGSPFIAPMWKAKVDAVVSIQKALEAVIVAPRNPAAGIIVSTAVSFGTASFTDNTIVMKILPVGEGESPIWPIIESAIIPTAVRSVNMRVIVDYTGVARTIKVAAVPVIEMVKPRVMPYILPYVVKEEMSQRSGIVSGAESIDAIVQLVPQIYKVNAVIAFPSWKCYMSGIPIPDVMPFSQLIVPTGVGCEELPTFPFVTSMTRVPEDIPSAFYGICVVGASSIATLDKIAIAMPAVDSSCEIVLAHDCSVQKLYTVVSTPVSSSGVRTIKIIVPGFKVEIARGFVHQGVIVKINGAIQSIPISKPLVITGAVNGVEMPVLNVTNNGLRHFITAPQVGIAVETDGIIVKVKVSPFLRSTACGICNYIPAVPVGNGAGVIPIIRDIHSAMFVVPRYLVRSAQCPAVRASAMA